MEPTQQNGLFRGTSRKGNGFWLAKHGENEKVFYDGPYGTVNASKSAAMKWLDQHNQGSKWDELDKRTKQFLDWIVVEEREGRITSEIAEMFTDKAIEVFYQDSVAVKVTHKVTPEGIKRIDET